MADTGVEQFLSAYCVGLFTIKITDSVRELQLVEHKLPKLGVASSILVSAPVCSNVIQFTLVSLLRPCRHQVHYLRQETRKFGEGILHDKKPQLLHLHSVWILENA